jgi:hypothetical protein
MSGSGGSTTGGGSTSYAAGDSGGSGTGTGSGSGSYAAYGAGGAAPGSAGFWDSLSNSWGSMQDTYTSLMLGAMGHDQEAQEFMDRAYNRGPLGQTQNSSGVYYYGTRGALVVATAAGTMAGGVLIYEGVLATGSGSITATRFVDEGRHFMVQINGRWFHALGSPGRMKLFEAASYEIPKRTFWNTMTVPLRNPANAAAVGESATRVYNCFTGAMRVVWSGF